MQDLYTSPDSPQRGALRLRPPSAPPTSILTPHPPPTPLPPSSPPLKGSPAGAASLDGSINCCGFVHRLRFSRPPSAGSFMSSARMAEEASAQGMSASEDLRSEIHSRTSPNYGALVHLILPPEAVEVPTATPRSTPRQSPRPQQVLLNSPRGGSGGRRSPLSSKAGGSSSPSPRGARGGSASPPPQNSATIQHNNNTTNADSAMSSPRSGPADSFNEVARRDAFQRALTCELPVFSPLATRALNIEVQKELIGIKFTLQRLHSSARCEWSYIDGKIEKACAEVARVRADLAQRQSYYETLRRLRWTLQVEKQRHENLLRLVFQSKNSLQHYQEERSRQLQAEVDRCANNHQSCVFANRLDASVGSSRIGAHRRLAASIALLEREACEVQRSILLAKREQRLHSGSPRRHSSITHSVSSAPPQAPAAPAPKAVRSNTTLQLELKRSKRLERELHNVMEGIKRRVMVKQRQVLDLENQLKQKRKPRQHSVVHVLPRRRKRASSAERQRLHEGAALYGERQQSFHVATGSADLPAAFSLSEPEPDVSEIEPAVLPPRDQGGDDGMVTMAMTGMGTAASSSFFLTEV